MTGNDQDARRAAWTSYWAAGGLHSCVGSFSGNYGGAIGEFWRTTFAAMPAGGRMLDLATGNGALPLLCREQSDGRGVGIDAVDLAQVAPSWFRPDEHADLRFHSGVAMEHLPFADAGFDLVASQFGFEYAEREPALAEALRVCRERGRIALVMHHAGSVLVDVGRAERVNLATLTTPGGLLDAAAAVIPWFAAARAGTDLAGVDAARRDREAYNTAARQLAGAITASRTPDLLVEARDRVQQLLAGTGPDPAPSLAALQDYRDALVAAGLRTAEMIEHALDGDAASALAAAIAAARPAWHVRCEPLRQREGVLGWALLAEPAG